MKTLALLYPGCIEFEILLACELLNGKFPVEVITPDGLDHVGSNGMIFKSSGSLTSVRADDYKIVLIPGGEPKILIGNETLNKFLRAAHSKGAIIGAICAGPIALAQAGLLEGRRIAHGYQESQFEFLRNNGFFVNTEFTDESVIVDDRIVTARPECFIDFAVEVAQLANVITIEKAASLKKYYRGN